MKCHKWIIRTTYPKTFRHRSQIIHSRNYNIPISYRTFTIFRGAFLCRCLEINRKPDPILAARIKPGIAEILTHLCLCKIQHNPICRIGSMIHTLQTKYGTVMFERKRESTLFQFRRRGHNVVGGKVIRFAILLAEVNVDFPIGVQCGRRTVQACKWSRYGNTFRNGLCSKRSTCGSFAEDDRCGPAIIICPERLGGVP